jgi:hypothetical protein
MRRAQTLRAVRTLCSTIVERPHGSIIFQVSIRVELPAATIKHSASAITGKE